MTTEVLLRAHTRALLAAVAAIAGAACLGPAPATSRHVQAAPATPSPSAAGAASVATGARMLADDTKVTTESGATLVAAKGWWLTERAGVVILEDPDRALSLTLLETKEPDALKALGGAWQRARPGFTRTLEETPTRLPPARGWEAITHVVYVTTQTERRVVEAIARRFGGVTYVALLDADAGANDRREAQIDAAIGTLRPPGMHEESLVGKVPRTLDAARVAQLDGFVAHAVADLAVPGAAVAVVLGGKVVYERAFGVRVRGRKDPVTPSTLFMMGSITKPMTTMMQATLVDAGTLAWTSSVTQLLPSFALGDMDAARKMELWHTACACTGMPRQDLEIIFEFAGVTPEQRLASMKTMKPTTGFGETFQYSNLMVAAGGYAAAHAAMPALPLGDAYDAVMRARIFEPLGMRSTTLDFAVAERAEHAMPHAVDIDGATQPVPLAMERNVLPIRPAGGVWSNLRDMERYAMTELAKGVAPDGRRIVSEANLLERWKMRVRSGDEGGYGLGLDVGTFEGVPVIAHDGGAFGFGTTMFLLPEQALAIVILTNVRNGGQLEELPFNEVVKRKAIELVFDGASARAASLLKVLVEAHRAAVSKGVLGLEREPEARWTQGLAGTYTHPALGTVRIATAAKGGTFDAGEWKSAFARKVEGDGAVRMVLVDAPFAGTGFIVGGDAANPTLTVAYGQMAYVLERSPRAGR